MEPRLLTRTHYQVNEPTYLEYIVRQCTSPTKSTYKETVAARVVDRLPPGWQLNKAAAGYAVDMTQALGLLTDSYNWAPLGVLLAIVSEVEKYDNAAFKTLSLPRKLAHCRVLLGGDGAALCFLLRFAADHGELLAGGQAANELATQMLSTILREYLELTSSIRERTRLRNELRRVTASPYGGNTGRHKVLFHVNSLCRLGLLRRDDPSALRFVLSTSGKRALEFLDASIPTTAALEKCASRGELMSVSARLMLDEMGNDSGENLRFDEHLEEAYADVTSLGFSVVSISLLLDVIQLRSAVMGIQLSRDRGLQLLEEKRKKQPKKLRFHVDRKGRPAYLVMERVDKAR